MVSQQISWRKATEDQAYPNSRGERIGVCTNAKLYIGSKYQRIRQCDGEYNEIQIGLVLRSHIKIRPMFVNDTTA